MTGITIQKSSSECLSSPPERWKRVRVLPTAMVETGVEETSLRCPRISEDDRLPVVLISIIVHATLLLPLAFFRCLKVVAELSG